MKWLDFLLRRLQRAGEKKIGAEQQMGYAQTRKGFVGKFSIFCKAFALFLPEFTALSSMPSILRSNVAFPSDRIHPFSLCRN